MAWKIVNHDRLWQRLQYLLHQRVSTRHNCIVTCGLLIGLLYLPLWFQDLLIAAARGSTAILLVAIVYLGLNELWQQRLALAQLTPSEPDRWLGYILILSAVLVFPFCRFALWSQAVVWSVSVAGIVCCTWGLEFFQKQLLVVVLFLISVYPQPGITGRIVWTTFTPPYLLENLMAWAGSLALQLVGIPAIAQGRFLILSGKAVEIGWGCNGFSMALNMAAASFLLGLFLQQSRLRIAVMMAIGMVLALLFNVPRIMLLAIAAIHWGQQAFDFWHGPIGGQMLSGILFTVYYYAVMGFVHQKPLPAQKP
jgi:exosortase/archaeosortase family protein